MVKKKLLSLVSVLFITLSVLYSQEFNVTGIVSDNNGEPVPSATIQIKGTTIGTISEFNGSFSLNVKKGDILLISFVGYNQQEITVKDESKLNVVLHEAVFGLNDIVVVGYGTQSRQTITSSISKVGSEALTNIPITSVGDGLKGKITGVRIYSTNNTPGAEPTIRIRGGSSINGSNEPLVLIDGVESGLSGINANDIQSIEVLKDAASTAIYGARASNGVLLITTKRGSYNKAPRVTFEANTAYQETARMYNFMNAEDYISIVRPAVALGPHPLYNYNSGYSASTGNTASSIYSTRYLENGETIPEGYKSMDDPLNPGSTIIFQDNDWESKIFSPSMWQNYYLGLDGGNEIMRYSASLGSTTDNGVAVGTGYNRLSARANADVNISKKLVLSTGFDFSHTNTAAYTAMNQYQVLTRGLAVPPTQKFFDSEGIPTHGYNRTSPTPLYYDYIYDDAQKNNKISINGALDWTIFDGLKAHVQGSYYKQGYQADIFQRANYFVGSRSASKSVRDASISKIEGYLSYSKTFNKVHSLSGLAGYSYQNNFSEYLSVTATGASSDKVTTLNAETLVTAFDNYIIKQSLVGYYGRLLYDYKKKYLAQASFRYDGSSLFGEGNKFGFFPGVSLGWVVTEEPFMQTAKQISNLKLRASYGQTGNNVVDVTDAAGSYSVGYDYGENAGLHPTDMPNNTLSWETTNQLDLGIDLGVFDNKILVNADYFNRLTVDLLFDKTLPNTTGFSTIKTNIGKVKYYGYEFEITTKNISTKNFDWESKFTWSFINHEVVQLPDNGIDKNRIGGVLCADGTYWGGIAEGERLDQFFTYQVDHIIETSGDADAAMYDDQSRGWRYNDQSYVPGRKEVGDYEYVDRDGNGKITSVDQFCQGVTIPKYTGGLNNSFRYKNWVVNVYLDWALGHSIYESVYSHLFLNTFANNWSLVDEVKQCWTTPGQDTQYARFTANDSDDGNKNYSRRTNIFAYKADYLCVRELSIQYNVPVNALKRFGIQGLAVTASGNNLYYFTAVPGMLSPEVGTGNPYASGFNVYPPIRRVSLGAKITF
ncbi:MAG: TonB-dependent receptor [Bacteroidales bacterium]|jgi:TonB-linked SusC/RagA family outer membrane protein|nr:TonB-dependent receptor [Bacteroidales bacterium]